MFDDAAKVGLDESRVLTQFFELVAIVFDVDSVLVLDIDSGNMFGFFGKDVSYVCVLKFVLLLLEIFFVGVSWCWGGKYAVGCFVGSHLE